MTSAQSQAPVSFTCHDCGHHDVGEPKLTMTGHQLCIGCYERLDAATCALMAESGIAGAGATAAWLHRLRRAVSKPSNA